METLTVEQVVSETIKILNSIKVPVSMINDIGIPIQKSVGNLLACKEAWKANAAKNEPTGEDLNGNADSQ